MIFLKKSNGFDKVEKKDISSLNKKFVNHLLKKIGDVNINF